MQKDSLKVLIGSIEIFKKLQISHCYTEWANYGSLNIMVVGISIIQINVSYL